jgi:RNA polymerase sigma factor (TIGR02999 family)
MNGTKATLDDLAPAIYDELRRLAGSYLARERSGHTLQPTALVHEAYVRMAQQHSVDWADRNQFLSCAASMMRRVLLNYARARSAEKRQQMLIQTTGRGAALPVVDFLDLHRALEGLAKLDKRQEKIVELRYFTGLTLPEIAQVMGLSPVTVSREWAVARLWLMQQIRQPQAGTV